MLRSLTLIAVWQKTHEARHAQPFALTRRDELIDYDLGAIGEIAELRLPQRQRIRLGQRIAVFETEHGHFRQHRIDDFIARLSVAEMIERCVASFVLLIDQHRVALREGATLGILTGQSHAVTFRPISFSVPMSTPVLPRRGSSASPAVVNPDQRPSSQSALLAR